MEIYLLPQIIFLNLGIETCVAYIHDCIPDQSIGIFQLLGIFSGLAWNQSYMQPKSNDILGFMQCSVSLIYLCHHLCPFDHGQV